MKPSTEKPRQYRTHTEVADRLGITLQEVQSTERRALRKLKRAVTTDRCLRQLAIDVGALPEGGDIHA